MVFKFFIKMSIILIAFIFLISGCGEDISIIPTETLKVTELRPTRSPISIDDTTTIEAIVDYSGDKTVLMYTWTASAGSIQGSGDKVTYKAPNTPGVYTINVVVTDGAISSGKTIEIRVTQQSTSASLIIDQNTHWPAESLKDKLAYDVKVNKLSGGKVTLHYDITQDQDKFDAFLSIEINKKIVQPEMAIGAEQPSTAKRTVRDIDVSNVITAPGKYLVIFYIRPGDRVRNGWLLNEAKLIGAEGSSDPQQ
ncbi:MAG: hypothetical protein ACUVWN_03445 [bacterium]